MKDLKAYSLAVCALPDYQPTTTPVSSTHTYGLSNSSLEADRAWVREVWAKHDEAYEAHPDPEAWLAQLLHEHGPLDKRDLVDLSGYTTMLCEHTLEKLCRGDRPELGVITFEVFYAHPKHTIYTARWEL